MKTFLELMERELFTDLECVAKADSNLYVVLGKTGSIITNAQSHESLDEAVKKALHYRGTPSIKTVERWLRADPGRHFTLSRNYDGRAMDLSNGNITVFVSSHDGHRAYVDALKLIRTLK